MKVYVVYTYGRGYEYVERIFSSKEVAERFVLEDLLSDQFEKIEESDCPEITWYYIKEYPVYRIQEYYVVD